MTGMRPVGRGNGSEWKYPPLSRYDQVSLTVREVLTLPPYIAPAPLATVDPTSRSNQPAVRVTLVDPAVSRGDLVMMFTAPVSALAPHTADAGPRTTSICLMSLKFVGTKSHRISPKKSR